MAVVAHCEDNSLIYGGAVHEGEFSKKYGVPGIPSVCESVHIARDILLAEATGCHYHVCHIKYKGICTSRARCKKSRDQCYC